MLRRAVGLEKVAVAAEDLVEIDLLAVRQHRASADRRGTVDAAKCAGGGFRKRAGCAGRHIDGAGLLIGYRRHETPAVVADAPKPIGGEIRAIALFGEALTNPAAATFILCPPHRVAGP